MASYPSSPWASHPECAPLNNFSTQSTSTIENVNPTEKSQLPNVFITILDADDESLLVGRSKAVAFTMASRPLRNLRVANRRRRTGLRVRAATRTCQSRRDAPSRVDPAEHRPQRITDQERAPWRSCGRSTVRYPRPVGAIRLRTHDAGPHVWKA